MGTTVHIRSALLPRPSPLVCPELACLRTFGRPDKLQEHIRNIHQTPLLCTRPGCTNRKPFGRQSDLNRHAQVVHKEGPTYSCPFEHCPRSYQRNDKLNDHLKARHPWARCPVADCGATVVDHPAEHEAHMAQAHGA